MITRVYDSSSSSSEDKNSEFEKEVQTCKGKPSYDKETNWNSTHRTRTVSTKKNSSTLIVKFLKMFVLWLWIMSLVVIVVVLGSLIS